MLVLGGAGWYFSGVIYNGGLNPEFTDSSSIGTAEDRVIVTNITSNSIQLNVEEELWGPLLERGIYGIIGQNGDALVGNILSTSGTIVERELLELNGTIVEGDRIRGTSLVIREKNNDYKIVTTEKDYYRLNNNNKKKIKYAKIELEIENKDKFINRILNIYD